MRTASDGSAAAIAVSSPGSTRTPDSGSASTPGGGTGTGSAGSVTSGRSDRMRTTRRADTWPRVSLSAASVMVRSGKTRNTAYP